MILTQSSFSLIFPRHFALFTGKYLKHSLDFVHSCTDMGSAQCGSHFLAISAAVECGKKPTDLKLDLRLSLAMPDISWVWLH